MRRLYLLASLNISALMSFGVLDTAVAGTCDQRPSHVDSLRQVLDLPTEVRLEWIPGRDGWDTLRVVDDFDRSEVGVHWARANDLWEIRNGELVLNSKANHEWRYLTVFRPIYNTPDRRILSISHRWGKTADEIGVREGAQALMIDKADQTGSGYWIWPRWGGLWLWIICNGAWDCYPDSGIDVDRVTAHANQPVAGDVVTTYPRIESDAVYLDLHVNGKWLGTVRDHERRFPKASTWYVGLFIHGESLNNPVDDFTVTWLERDVVSPAKVTDLQVAGVTSSTISLEWISPGDNFLDGQADRLEIRKSTSPITAENFDAAEIVNDVPNPAEPCNTQSFTISDLVDLHTYYVALRVYDEVGNAGPISNVVSATTSGAGIPHTLTNTGGSPQILPVGSNSEPLRVHVADAYGDAVSGADIVFSIVSGDGTFQDGIPPALKTYRTSTGAEGLAEAVVKASLSYGDTTSVIAKVEGSDSPGLQTDFIVVAAPPDSIAAIGGDQQTAPPGSQLEQPLRVRLLDLSGAPIANYTVAFRIQSGEGTLANGSAQFDVPTDSDGNAETTWTLGPAAGEQQVTAVAEFPGTHLRNSPITFRALAVATTVSASHSTLATEPKIAIPADSISATTITVTLRDELDNPVPGKQVEILVSGSRNFITPALLSSDEHGIATAELRSTKAEWKTVIARADGSVRLADSVSVQFVPLVAEHLSAHQGMDQAGDINQVLAEPVVVFVNDRFENPVGGVNVTFSIIAGGGQVVGEASVESDSNGLAQATWQLGPEGGTNQLQAEASGISAAVVFTATAIDPSAVGERTATLPTEYALRQNHPNPFNPETNIGFDLLEPSHVSLGVYDACGRLVRQLVAGFVGAGSHEIRWDGRNDQGSTVESGVYFYRLQAQSHLRTFAAARKLVLLK